MFVASGGVTTALMWRVLLRTIHGWEQGVFNEELNWGVGKNVSCCHAPGGRSFDPIMQHFTKDEETHSMKLTMKRRPPELMAGCGGESWVWGGPQARAQAAAKRAVLLLLLLLILAHLVLFLLLPPLLYYNYDYYCCSASEASEASEASDASKASKASKASNAASEASEASEASNASFGNCFQVCCTGHAILRVLAKHTRSYP